MLHTLKLTDINPADLESLAGDRVKWRGVVKKGLEKFEGNRLELINKRRLHRKEKATSSLTVTYAECPECGRPCGSRIGFF